MDCNIIKNGHSEYVLLLPDRATSFEKIASDLFNKYLNESANVTLPIVFESELKANKYVSIGNTNALKDKNLPVRHGKGGYTVTEKDGNLYIYGQGTSGVIWATQAFLEKATGYKFFANDEILIEKRVDIDATGYDFFYTPSVEHRSSGFAVCKKDEKYAMGLKAYTGFGGRADGTPFWGTWNSEFSCHNHLKILPPEKYYSEHPEWYNAKKNQLCLSNDEMRDEFFKNLITYFEKYSDQTHFILGHEDNYDVCDCAKCRKKINELTTGGLQMEFINDIARRTEKWRKKNCPEREINVGMFAYTVGASMTPPVKNINGKILPVSDSVVAEPNVFVLFAPIDMKEHSRPITDPENAYYYRCFEAWNVICKRFGIWMYYGSFRRSFEFSDGIYCFKDNLTALKKFGLEYFYYECNSSIGSVIFQKMLVYLFTSLEWDLSKDTDSLIDEFMQGYYKCAAKPMRRFLDYLMNYYEKARARTEKFTGKKFHYGMCLTDTIPDGFWSLNAVYDLVLILEEAEKMVEISDYSENEKNKLRERIEIEKLFTTYIQLEYFVREMSPYDEARSINFFPKNKALELVSEFERGCKKFDIKCVDGDGVLEDTLGKWRKEINCTARAWEERIEQRFAYIDMLMDNMEN